MTQENIFKEIEEDLERQKYEELWKRYGGYVIAAAFAVVLGTIGYNFWQTRTSDMHQKATGDLMMILGQDKEDQAKQIQALEDFAQKNQDQAQAVFAQLDAAAFAAKQDHKDQAIKIYDAVAADVKADHAFRQLADLLSVQLQLDSGDPTALQKRLQPLMEYNEPWHYSAKEYSAYLAFRAGDMATAKKLFTDLSQDAGAPKSMSTRASDMLKMLAE